MFEGHCPSQRRKGNEVQAVELVLSIDRLPEMLKYIGKQKYVRPKVMVVVLLHILDAEMSPRLTSTIVIDLREGFVFQGVVKR